MEHQVVPNISFIVQQKKLTFFPGTAVSSQNVQLTGWVVHPDNQHEGGHSDSSDKQDPEAHAWAQCPGCPLAVGHLAFN